MILYIDTDRLLVSELTLAEIAATPSDDLSTAMAQVADRCETVAVACGADMVVSVRRKTREVVDLVNTMHGYAHTEIAAPGELL